MHYVEASISVSSESPGLFSIKVKFSNSKTLPSGHSSLALKLLLGELLSRLPSIRFPLEFLHFLLHLLDLTPRSLSFLARFLFACLCVLVFEMFFSR